MLRTKEVAAELGVSESTVREYADEGLIPCSRTLKGHRRFVLEDVRQAVERLHGWKLEPLGDDEAPRLGDVERPPLQLARRDWSPAITRASVADAVATEESNAELRIPFIGVPGSSRFTVGGGARI